MLVGNAISSNLRSLIFKIFRGSMPPDPPRRTKISVRRFAAIRNFCILLGTHSKFGLDPRLVSGSEDRGGDDNSIQLINFGKVGDQKFEEWQQKIGGWKGG